LTDGEFTHELPRILFVVRLARGKEGNAR